MCAASENITCCVSDKALLIHFMVDEWVLLVQQLIYPPNHVSTHMTAYSRHIYCMNVYCDGTKCDFSYLSEEVMAHQAFISVVVISMLPPPSYVPHQREAPETVMTLLTKEGTESTITQFIGSQPSGRDGTSRCSIHLSGAPIFCSVRQMAESSVAFNFLTFAPLSSFATSRHSDQS